MIDEKSFNKIASTVLIAVLVILTFLILRPILISSIFGLILAFIFYPLYKKFLSWTKNTNLSASLACVILLAIIILPLLFFISILVKQTFEIYTFIQGTDFLTPIYDAINKFFSSPELSKDLIVALNTFTSRIASSFLSEFTDILLSSPIILLQFLIILFVFFFGLRDGEKLVAYIQSLSPLSKETEKKMFQQFKDITYSVIYGNILIGIIHGLVTGAALFILKIPNALVLTLIAIFFSVLPIFVGPWLVWVPVDIYLFSIGRTTSAIILLIYGLVFISWIDNILRPLIVSKRTKINSAVILVSMLGGLFVFGVLGLIIGPLVISYLLLILESYRKTSNKDAENIFIYEAK